MRAGGARCLACAPARRAMEPTHPSRSVLFFFSLCLLFFLFLCHLRDVQWSQLILAARYFVLFFIFHFSFSPCVFFFLLSFFCHLRDVQWRGEREREREWERESERERARASERESERESERKRERERERETFMEPTHPNLSALFFLFWYFLSGWSIEWGVRDTSVLFLFFFPKITKRQRIVVWNARGWWNIWKPSILPRSWHECFFSIFFLK